MRRKRRYIFTLAAASASAALAIAGSVALQPDPKPMLRAARTATTVCDRRGRLLRTFLGMHDEQAVWVKLADVNPDLIHATLAIEDKRFYRHWGVDPWAVLRAAVCNVRSGRIVSGASTITMQLARLLEPKDRTWANKVRETLLALRIEWALSKRGILEAYLNLAPYGGNVIGVEAAARRYFGKPARNLSLPQAAALAGLPQSPARLRPDRHPVRARRRRDEVLRQMLAAGYIDAGQLAAALAEPVTASAHRLPFHAPHFARLVRDRYGAGRRVVTTLDLDVQAIAEAAVRAGVDSLRNHGIGNAAAVVIDNATGRVAAMVGSADFFDDEAHGQVNAALAPRSPGSALKPFTYALAFERGVAAPDTALADAPCHFGAYSPENYDRRYRGPVRASDALAQSLNVPAVRLLDAVGPARLDALLRRLGISTLDRAGGRPSLSLTLGACEVRLLELTNAYAALARLGVYKPYALLADERCGGARVLSGAACYLVADALLATRPADATGPRVALKTGTSNGHRDAWAVGFNPEWTVGAWAGNASGRPARALVGIQAAAPMVYAIFRQLYGQGPGPWYERPASIGERKVCAASGMIAGPHCPATRVGLFIKGVSPTAVCTVHRQVLVDDSTGSVLCSRCCSGRSYHSEVVEQWPAELAAWLAAQGRLPAQRAHFAGCPSVHDEGKPRIVSPVDGQCYALADGACGMSSRLLLAAANASGRVCWFVDGGVFRWAAADGQVFWPLQPGPHTITCVDDTGRGASARVVVKQDGRMRR